ncbi:ATP-grasp domain-containing protein [Oceanirhabdus sp. W0125-5]|uniref:ATP-grasp domain-containing protein n=1 Tax=Oceanirhabdus sp. W0125-5 TaxID=2999116 RepID=UPI0022F2D7E2|nr:ATP-grasp domain-containing protein [Oceanirhabdus sp. W0125-5]WBW96220.1 ATP-grasp domain-containing protein [Oceanirhabdus sp. W0125-5]
MSNNNRVILVTGVGGDIGQSVVKCIKRRTNDKVIGCDIDYYGGGKAFVDKFYVAPRVSEGDRYIDFIKFVVREEKISHIIPITEYEIKLFTDKKIEKLFKEVKVVINNQFITSTFLDKYKTIEFFMENQISYPKTIPLDQYNNEFQYPVIIKEKSSRGGKGVYIVNCDRELEQYTKEKKDALVQEFIGNEDEEYTMAVFSDGKNVNCIAFRRILGYGSLSKFVQLINDEKIMALGKKIAEKTQLKGSINVQMRKCNGEYIPFEVNPRISSTVAFRDHFGFKDVIWWLELVDNENIEIKYKTKYSKGIGVRVVDEVYFDLQEK